MAHGEILESELQKFQLDLPDSQKLLLARYCDELVHWNQKINLTGLTGANMVRRLVVEPVWVGLRLKPSGMLVDIGSGNGSPAIPLHIVSHLDKTHLIEARTKRAVFLRHLAASLKLSDLAVHHARFQEVAPILGSPDWITLQGVALSPELVDSIRQISSKTTTVVWITSGVEIPINPVQVLEVPITGTQVFLLRWDHSWPACTGS